MAGNSSTFYLRQQVNDSNIKQWQNWAVDINYVVEQFNDVINNLVDRLNTAEMTIEALIEKINNSEDNYVKLQFSSIQIASSDKAVYTKSCGVFSNVILGDNIVYVYANKTIDGLYLDNKPVEFKTTSYNSETTETSESTTTPYLPFMSFTGSDAGTIHTIKTNNAAKNMGGVKLYFSHDPQLDTLETSLVTAELPITINYSTVVTKSLYTIDKSSLSKVIPSEAIISNIDLDITKQAASVGQYSTIKTVAEQASSRNSGSSRSGGNSTSNRR